MINDRVQKQEGGDGSTNLQVQSMVIQGPSYSDIKQIALDVYKSNALQLSEDASKIAIKRAEELSNDFFEKLKEKNEIAISEMAQPGMQSALYEAQKQYAKTGDKDLEGLLVNILVERASIPERNIQQIVLDEALIVASKLTVEHMDALTVNFMLSKVTKNIISLESYSDLFKTHILPFTNKLNDFSSCYEHLKYAGCGSILETISNPLIQQSEKEKYPAFFSKGFDKEKFNNDVGDISLYSDLLISNLHSNELFHLHSNNLFQFKALNLQVFEDCLVKEKITDENKKKLILLFHSTLMNHEEVKNYLLTIDPKMQNLLNLWDNSSISKFSPTTVGIALAIANFTRKTGITIDIGIWIK